MNYSSKVLEEIATKTGRTLPIKRNEIAEFICGIANNAKSRLWDKLSSKPALYLTQVKISISSLDKTPLPPDLVNIEEVAENEPMVEEESTAKKKNVTNEEKEVTSTSTTHGAGTEPQEDTSTNNEEPSVETGAAATGVEINSLNKEKAPHTNIKFVNIADIIIPENRRKLRNIQGLVDSIKMSGLLNPIIINKDNILIAGLHRLKAGEILGWKEIEARIVELDKLRAELAEIDENIVRNQLSELEEDKQLVRRKVLYEVLNPDAQAGVRRAAGMNKSIGNDVNDILSPTFVTDTAAKTGLSERTVQRKLEIGSKIIPVVYESVLGTDLETNQASLLTISRAEPTEQMQVFEKLLEKQKKGRSNGKPSGNEIEAKPHYIPEDQFREIVAGLERFYANKTDNSTTEITHPDCVMLLRTGNTSIDNANKLEKLLKLVRRQYSESKIELIAPANSVSANETVNKDEPNSAGDTDSASAPDSSVKNNGANKDNGKSGKSQKSVKQISKKEKEYTKNKVSEYNKDAKEKAKKAKKSNSVAK